MDSDEREALAAFNAEGFDASLEQKESEKAKAAEDEAEQLRKQQDEEKKRAAADNAARHRVERQKMEREAQIHAAEEERRRVKEEEEEARRQAELDRKAVHYSKDFDQKTKAEEQDMYEQYKKQKLVPVGAKEGRFESGDQRIPFDRSMIPPKPY